MMGLLGWQTGVRVICATTPACGDSDFCSCSASGCKQRSLLWRHVIQLCAAFYTPNFDLHPIFILTGSEPEHPGPRCNGAHASGETCMRGFEDFSTLSANPGGLFPSLSSVIVVMCFQLVLPSQEAHSDSPRFFF